MSLPLRIIGLGQTLAGDDGVGLAVVRALQAHALPQSVELLTLADASALVELCASDAALLIVIDALLGETPGEVTELSVEALSALTPGRVSSHGLSVAQAIGLARALAGGAALPTIHLIAITIHRPERYANGLSPAVAAAVPLAVERVLARVTEHTSVERARA